MVVSLADHVLHVHTEFAEVHLMKMALEFTGTDVPGQDSG
jgi:hypothetical protein